MTPLGAKGIMLKKEVILTVMPYQAIGIIHPIFRRREMKLWPIFTI